MSIFSLEWNARLWSIGSCSNCKADTWERDWVFYKQSKGRDRYSCLYCGHDYYPGGAVSLPLAEAVGLRAVPLGVSSSGGNESNITDDSQER